MPAEKPLPKPTVDLTPREAWTEENARAIFCNPVYAGIADYPPLVSDETWVRAAAKAIKEDGAEQWLVNMLYVLRASLATHTVG